MSTTVQMPDRIEHWPRARLKRYKRNARTHSPEQVQKIANSLLEFGWTNPILVDVASEEIIAGHGRLDGAELLDVDPVPVIPLSHLTDAQRRAYIIADNRLALDAGWDEDLLGQELADLQDEGFDLALTGFDEDELEDLLPDMSGPEPTGTTAGDPDAVPEMPPAPTTRPGDLWRLGSHRLLCGDSTSQEDVDRLMAGELADCLWTDPPYNVNYESAAGSIQNDNMDDAAFAEFLGKVYGCAIAAMRPGAPAYIAHADTEGVAFRREFERAGFYLSSCLIWRKNSLVLGRSDYHWQHEPILYGWKPGAAHTWYGERNKTTIHEFDAIPVQQLADNQWQIGQGETAIIVSGDNVELQVAHGTVFLEEKPRRNADHPTMKPVGLIERQLRNSAKRKSVVLDLFGGSGSTLIACQNLDMVARLMELDERYADVIVKRWQDYTGREARLEETGESFAEVQARRRGGGMNRANLRGLPEAANDPDGAIDRVA